MEVRNIPIEDIKPYAKNPRNNKDAVEKVAESIKEFGWKQPIVIDMNGVIIAGHTRYKAAQKLGITSVPVVCADDLTEEQVKAYRLADNKTAGFSTWDMELLELELEGLQTASFDMARFGFEEAVLEPEEIKEDDFNANEILDNGEEPVSKPGDIWTLGRHKLLCGDSTKTDAVQRLMAVEKAHMIWTDPPWNVDYGASKNPRWKSGTNRRILNDSMSTDEFGAFLLAAFANMRDSCLEGAMAYVVMSAQEWGNIMNAMRHAGFHWSSTIIWAKDQLVLSRKDYHTQYEPIWYGWKDGEARLCPLEDRKQSDVWMIDRPKRSDEHPTMKPIELVARSITNSSRKDDLVIDFFGGSGSTLIAAEETGRRCNMIELDPKYCDVIINRWQKLTGKTAELLSR